MWGNAVIRRHVTALRVALTTADAASSIVLFVALSSIILGIDWRREWEASTGTDPLIPALAYALAWTGASWLVGMYRPRSNWTIAADLRAVLRLGVIVACATVLTIFVL